MGGNIPSTCCFHSKGSSDHLKPSSGNPNGGGNISRNGVVYHYNHPHHHQQQHGSSYISSTPASGAAGGGMSMGGSSSTSSNHYLIARKDHGPTAMATGMGGPGMPEYGGYHHQEVLHNNNINSNNKHGAIEQLQHIGEREPEDIFEDPSGDPHVQTIFLSKFNELAADSNREERIRRRRSELPPYSNLSMFGGDGLVKLIGTSKKFSSCSTVFIDDSTVSQPNLKNTIKCVALAIFYHIRNRNPSSDASNHQNDANLEIFNEQLHPLTDDYLAEDYAYKNPDHRLIYRFLRLLFSSAQLTAEVAIVTLIYLERLLYYGEIEISPITWKRMVLGAVLLASKVWDDQAVWNIDYCGILPKLQVHDMNELERQYLEMIQFNINVPSGVYAKYYFDLRTLADKNDFVFPVEPLDKNRAAKLEATSRICENMLKQIPLVKKSSSLEAVNKKANRLSTIVIS